MYNSHELQQFGNELTSCFSQPSVTIIHIFAAQEKLEMQEAY